MERCPRLSFYYEERCAGYRSYLLSSATYPVFYHFYYRKYAFTCVRNLDDSPKKKKKKKKRLLSNDSLFPLPCISARSMPDAILNKRKPGGNERRETSQIRIDETKKPRYTCDLRTVGGSQWKAQQICMTPITSNPGKFGTNG